MIDNNMNRYEVDRYETFCARYFVLYTARLNGTIRKRITWYNYRYIITRYLLLSCSYKYDMKKA